MTSCDSEDTTLYDQVIEFLDRWQKAGNIEKLYMWGKLSASEELLLLYKVHPYVCDEVVKISHSPEAVEHFRAIKGNGKST